MVPSTGWQGSSELCSRVALGAESILRADVEVLKLF